MVSLTSVPGTPFNIFVNKIKQITIEIEFIIGLILFIGPI
jgi:hypothetical protein